MFDGARRTLDTLGLDSVCRVVHVHLLHEEEEDVRADGCKGDEDGLMVRKVYEQMGGKGMKMV